MSPRGDPVADGTLCSSLAGTLVFHMNMEISGC